MTASAHPHRRIRTSVLPREGLIAERTELLENVGFESSHELFEHIDSGAYSVQERIVAERIESIEWLLGRDE